MLGTDLSIHTLTSTELIIGSGNITIPTTLTFKSSNGAKALTLSTDGGLEYFTPEIDTTTATMLVVAINSPITNVKVVGDIGDKLYIGQ